MQGEVQCSGIQTHNEDDNMHFQSVEKKKEGMRNMLSAMGNTEGWGGRKRFLLFSVYFLQIPP